MIYLTDAAGQCVYTSAEWTRLTGQSCEDALGHGWLVRVHPEDRAVVEGILDDATRQAAEFNIRYRHLIPVALDRDRSRASAARAAARSRARQRPIAEESMSPAVGMRPDDTCRWIGTGGVPSFGARGDAFAGYIGTITELAGGATDTINAYGKVGRFRPPAPHPAILSADALDLVADYLIMAHALIEGDGGKEALPDLRKALFKVGQAIAARIAEKSQLN